MEKGHSFCEECNKIVQFDSRKKTLIGRIHGLDCEYYGTVALCPNCNSELYVAEYEDENLEALKDSYRKNNNILTLNQMNELLERYNIGKRPFSTVIGLGEITFTKYLENALPSRSNSDLLNNVYLNPVFYKDLLMKNKDLINKSAFEKSLEAVDKFIALKEHENISESKIKIIAAYIISQSEDITQLMLQKMLYYIQALYWLYYKKFLFTEDCEAWVHGPVYRVIYDKYKDYHFDSLEEKTITKPNVTTDEKTIADLVIKYFGCYSGRILEKFTHLETPWLKTREGLQENERSDRIIDKELLKEYFSENIGSDVNKFIPNVENYTRRQFSVVMGN